MKKEYLLILPSVFIGEPFTIGNITFERFGSEDNRLTDDKSRELLMIAQQMLMNNGFSGIFTYYYFTSEDNFQKILLNIRKVITLFRYIAFEKHPDLNLESLIYYLFTPIKMEVNTPEMKYSLEGLRDGSIQIHFWAPGFKEVTRERNYPPILHLDNEHFLIQKFNSNQLEEKYIIAIERFNRTFKETYDAIEDVLNLTTAFEHILEKADSAKLFSRSLVHALGLDCINVEPNSKNSIDNLRKWGKEFYQVRSEVFHGDAFKHYSDGRGYEFWEECFKWKHPTGTIRYVNHVFIAKKIFQLLIERLLSSGKIENDVVQKTSSEAKRWLEEVECRILLEDEIEPLITPNEVYYRKLKELVYSKESFGLPYYEFLWRIKRYDGTEEKVVLLYLLKHFSNLTEERFPDLKIECKEMTKLVEEENITLLSVKAIELSQKIYKKDFDKKEFDDEEVYNSNLAGFFEKVFYSLSQIAWLEKLKSSS